METEERKGPSVWARRLLGGEPPVHSGKAIQPAGRAFNPSPDLASRGQTLGGTDSSGGHQKF